MDKSNLIKDIDLDISRKITMNQALKYEVLPLYEENNLIYVLTSKDSTVSNDYLKFLLKKELTFLIKPKEEVLNLIKLVLDYEYEELEEKIFEEAVDSNASDIHFEIVDKSLHIRFRINGDLILVRKLKLEEYNSILSRLKVKSNLDITERRRPQDGKLIVDVNNKKYNCRISTIPVIDGEKIVIRILYGEKFLNSIEELDFTAKQKEKLKKIISLKNGLTLFNGPTGSGKSTTLYTILNMIRNNEINITTLEDPIEVNMLGINQINLNPKIGLTFAEGLRSILRQDPDVIMIGEIRDEETAKMAVRASITGHKVYSTIHTKSPEEVYFRLEEMGVKEYLIRDALVGIISQRLVKVLCDKCKKKIGVINIKNEKIPIYKKCGCSKCNETGYKGRTVVASVNYIDKKTKESLKNKNLKNEVLSNAEMEEGLVALLKNGAIDYNDYLQFVEGEELIESK